MKRITTLVLLIALLLSLGAAARRHKTWSS